MDQQQTASEDLKRLPESRKRKFRYSSDEEDDDDPFVKCKELKVSFGVKGIPDNTSLDSNFNRKDENTSPESEDGIQALPTPGEVPLKRMIQENYVYLKRELDPDEIVDHLSDFLDQREVDRIQECPTRMRRTDLLLKTLVHAEENNRRSQTKKRFFTSLLNCKYKHIFEKLNARNETKEKSTQRFGHKWCKNVLSNQKEYIYDNIEPLLFIDEILDGGGLDFNDHEDITNMIHREQRVATLLKLIKKNFDKAPLFLQPMVREYKMLRIFNNKKQELPVEQQRNVTCCKVTTHKDFGCCLKGYPLPNMTIKVKFNFWIENNEKESPTGEAREKIQQIEFNVVKRGNKKKSKEMFDLIMNDCTSKFEKMSISSVIFHIKAFSNDALQKAISACKNGKASEWLFKLLTEEEFKVLQELNVEKVNVTLLLEKDQEDDISDFGDETTQNLTLSDLEENWSYLLEELDAKIFVDHLFERGRNFDGLVKCISEEKSRSKRTTLLLRSLKTKQDLTWFEKHIQQKRNNIWKHIFQSKLQKKDTPVYDLTHKIFKKYDRICQELEPRRLKGTLIVEKMRHSEDYQDSEVGRKERVGLLLKQIFDQKDESLVQVFMTSLQQAGYDALTKEILQVPSIEYDTSCHLESTDEKKVLFVGTYDVVFNAVGQKEEDKLDTCNNTESDFASESDALSCQSTKEEPKGSNDNDFKWTRAWVKKHFSKDEEDKCSSRESSDGSLEHTFELPSPRIFHKAKIQTSTETVSFLSDNMTSLGSVCSESISPSSLRTIYRHKIKVKETKDLSKE